MIRRFLSNTRRVFHSRAHLKTYSFILSWFDLNFSYTCLNVYISNSEQRLFLNLLHRNLHPYVSFSIKYLCVAEENVFSLHHFVWSNLIDCRSLLQCGRTREKNCLPANYFWVKTRKTIRLASNQRSFLVRTLNWHLMHTNDLRTGIFYAVLNRNKYL